MNDVRAEERFAGSVGGSDGAAVNGRVRNKVIKVTTDFNNSLPPLVLWGELLVSVCFVILYNEPYF